MLTETLKALKNTPLARNRAKQISESYKTDIMKLKTYRNEMETPIILSGEEQTRSE